jgi:hypothetical protein
MKIIVLVLSYTGNTTYSDFYNTQKTTWDSIHVDDVQTFYLLGNSDKNEIVDNIIFTDVKESESNCGYKTIKAFELLKNYDYDFIFRTNSGSYVDKFLLQKYSIDKPSESFYSGVIGHHNNISFASGSGYFISRDLVDLVLEKKDIWDHAHIDDVALGKLLSQFGVKPSPSQRYDLLTPLTENISMNYFHYRLKNMNNRQVDVENMKKIFDMKTTIQN